MSSIVRASAPAKIILLEEHFVVHGQPAIALAIDNRATISVNLRKDAIIKPCEHSSFLGTRWRGATHNEQDSGRSQS